MFIHDPPKRSTRKELKVNLPARQHRQLRAYQHGSGQEATRIVADALGLYFEKLAQEAEASQNVPVFRAFGRDAKKL